MESKILRREDSPPNQSRQQIGAQIWVLDAFIFLTIEIVFILKLAQLIRGHAPLWYVSSAAAFQLTLVMAALTYRRVWRMLRTTEPSTQDQERLLGKIGYMVLCLLFALMSYSSFAADAATTIH